MRERQLVQCVWDCNLFQEMFRFDEVRVGAWSRSTKRIDMVALERLDGEGRVIAIEAKISDWKTALRQAFRNLFAVDLSYVALPDRAAARVDMPVFRDTGIGLLAVDGNVKCLLDPIQSALIVPEKKKFVMETCRKRVGGTLD